MPTVASGLASSRLWRVYLRVGGCCAYCGRALRIDEAHLDHEAGPEAVAAAAEEELQCACADCREEKGPRTGAEYRALRRLRLAREMAAVLGRPVR